MDEKTTIQEDGDLSLATRAKPRLKQPSLFKVIILNDDYTPMEFVVEILEKFFDKICWSFYQNSFESFYFTNEAKFCQKKLAKR